MSDSLELQVITPERTVLAEVTISSLIVPALDGFLGILPNHAPLVAGLDIGIVKYKAVGDERYTRLAITGGFLEVSDNHAVLVADAAEEAATIDLMRARQAAQRAEKRLKERSALVDYARAELSLRRAVNRIRVTETAD